MYARSKEEIKSVINTNEEIKDLNSNREQAMTVANIYRENKDSELMREIMKEEKSSQTQI